MIDTKTNMIFKNRVGSYYQSLCSLYKSSIDWVIWLYIIIPCLAIFIGQYVQWWNRSWNINLSIVNIEIFLYLGLFIMMVKGNLRFFMERADELFFRQYVDKYQHLKRLGVYYSLTVSFLLWGFVFIIIAPILLVQFEKTFLYFISLFIVSWCGSNLMGAVRQVVSFNYRGWVYYVVIILVNAFLLLVYGGIIYVLNWNDPLLTLLTVTMLTLFTYLGLYYRLKLKGTFLEELANEITLKYRFLSATLQGASLIGAPQFQRLKRPKYNKRPWLFRKSGRIFSKRTPEKGFIELHIKYILRNKNKWMLFLQMSGALLFAITITPDPLKWIIWAVGIFMFVHLNSALVGELKQSNYLKTFEWDREKILNFSMKSIFWTNAPFLVLISGWAGFLLISWLGSLILIFLALGISTFIQPFMEGK
ncbi:MULTISPECIES: ABC transporter permease [Bacillaceae]|uniref:ABC transporter permease n=1 Tax=Evansella alkalicola TaxID=745819 RepID=A0ABS6JQF6_9BACI|nr:MULTISPECIES: ABC transporter permease [Bacillaceae]MBU9720788.1 ABC transporter permease [Bacillus alkalicola]